MIDRYVLDAIVAGLSRVPGVTNPVLDDILTRPLVFEVGGGPCGYLVTLHEFNTPNSARAAYFSMATIYKNGLPQWCYMMRQE